MSKAYLALQVAVVNHFSNKAELDAFMTTPNSSFDNQTPKDWFMKSRRRDRLEFAIDTIDQLKREVTV